MDSDGRGFTPFMVSRLAHEKGAKARWRDTTKEQRREIARKAARARWTSPRKRA
jgi:hypothetical protein